jgi:hypothetical protein
MKSLVCDGKKGAGSGHSRTQKRGLQDAERAKERVCQHLLCAGWEAGHTCPASSALTQFSELFQSALFQAGNLFEPAPSELTAHLASLLRQYGCKTVQTRTYCMTYQANTPSAQVYYEDMQRAFQTLRPFILKWGPRSKPADYDALCQQALAEIQQSNFQATWNLLTAWGTT